MQLVFPRLEKVSHTRYTEERNVCVAYPFRGFWRLLVNKRVTLERVCLPCKWNCEKKKRVSEDEVFIENTCLGIGSKKRGTKFKWGCSFKQWSRGSPGHWFPETEYLLASAIFVVGTSGIPHNLNCRSVSPIKASLEESILLSTLARSYHVIKKDKILCKGIIYVSIITNYVKTEGMEILILHLCHTFHNIY